MSQPPGEPEFYTPPPQQTPSPPPPPMIGDAANQWERAQTQGEHADLSYASPPAHQPLAGPPPMAPPYSYMQQPPGRPASQGLAITALVLGVIALITGWIPVWAILLGVIAVILGSIAIAKRQPKGMAIGGIVTGVIGALFSLGILLIAIFAISEGADPYSSWEPEEYHGDVPLGPQSVDGSIVLAEQAFGATSYDDGTWWFVVVLDNSQGEAYEASDFTIEALDANGEVLDSQWSYVAVPQGESAISGAFYEIGAEGITELRVTGPSPETAGTGMQTGELAVSSVQSTSDDWSTTVTATVESTFEEDTYGGVVTFVARDASGQIIGASNGYVEEMSQGDTAQVEAFFYEILPEGTTFTAYASNY